MNRKPLKQLLDRYNVYVANDSVFASRTRLLQSIWREEKGYPFEEYGNQLPVEFAKSSLSNYLTEKISKLVEEELQNKEKMIGKPRIWNNLLSSQPLAFNLFGELKLEKDFHTSTAVFSKLFPGKVERVTRIEFEYSPGRRNSKYTNDRSAFDVFVEYSSTKGEKCFFGIEVKYSEAMNDSPAQLRKEYDRIAGAMGIFRTDMLNDLKYTSIQQLWRDHLLAGSMFITNSDYDRGDFIVLYPDGNVQCQKAIEKYQQTFKSDKNFFIPLTLEKFHRNLSKVSQAEWVTAFYDRYLDFSKLEKL